MRTLLLILLSTSLSAETGVIVRSTDVVVGKEVYSGDASRLEARLEERRRADPSLSFRVIDLDVPENALLFRALEIPAEETRKAQKQQALLDVRNTNLTANQRFQALLILLDYDR